MARKLVFDRLDPASVTYCVNAARENARQVREEISTEQWQRLNRLFHQMHSPHAQAQFRSSMNDALPRSSTAFICSRASATPR